MGCLPAINQGHEQDHSKNQNYDLLSNRGQPQIEADSNTSQNVKASLSGLSNQTFKNSSKIGCLDQNWLIAIKLFALALMLSKMTLIEAEGNLDLE